MRSLTVIRALTARLQPSSIIKIMVVIVPGGFPGLARPLQRPVGWSTGGRGDRLTASTAGGCENGWPRVPGFGVAKQVAVQGSDSYTETAEKGYVNILVYWNGV